MVIKANQEYYGGYNIMETMETKSYSTNKIVDIKSDSYNFTTENNNSKSYVANMPTKGYIDKVIAQALTNIKNGENVSENRRILAIFSNITGENPITKELNAYI